LHDKPVNELTRKDIRDRRDQIAKESGSVSANRALAYLSSLCGWVIEQEYIAGSNPTADIKPLHEQDRERVLSEEELVDIWLACGDDDYGRIVKLLMLTGQRRQEIGGLEWSEIRVKTHIDDETKIETKYHQIELPKERTKNNRPHIIPLSEPALALLRDLPRERHHVFGVRADGFVSWGTSKPVLDKRIAERRGAPLPHWTIHDIRRSVVTHISELGYAQPHVVEAIVNHISGSKAGVAGVYNRATYLPEKRWALEQWGRYLTGLVGAPLCAQQSNTRETSDEISGQLLSGTRGDPCTGS